MLRTGSKPLCLDNQYTQDVGSSSLAAHHFRALIFGVRIMRSIQYRKIAAECLDRARHAYKSEDVDAWLLIAEDWLRLAIESEAADGQPRGSSQR